MELYYHKTDGGAEYYSTTFLKCPNGQKEGTAEGFLMRTDGNEIEIYIDELERQGIKLKITNRWKGDRERKPVDLKEMKSYVETLTPKEVENQFGLSKEFFLAELTKSINDND